MPARRRPTLRDRLLCVGLQTRLVAAAAVLVLACGGFLAYRSVAAIRDAYRWTGEAEASAVAHGFARSLGPRDLDDLERIRARLVRLSGVHPDLTGVEVTPAPDDSEQGAVYAQHGRDAQLAFPIVDGRGRTTALLRLRFALDERAEALASGRREVLLAGLGAGLLLVIGFGVLSRLLIARPVE